jgi:hypothetical protein
VTYSLDELAGKHLEHAKGVLIGKPGAQLLPTFHIQFTNRDPVIMATPWSDEREKSIVIATIRSAIQHFRQTVDSYAFMSEAWIATEDRNTPADVKKLMPREREDRREAVIITAFNKDTGFMRSYEIERGADGAVSALKDIEPYDECGGRLHNLFEDA